MIDEPRSEDHVPYDPASMVTSSLVSTVAVWYKRPWFLITVAIIVVVGVSIITDLPHPISKTEDIAAQNASMHQINTDIAPCVYAIKESFNFYNEDVAGTLSSSKLKTVRTYLVADQSACSFTSGQIYDLTNNIQVLDTTAGKKIDQMLSGIVLWITSDALAAIEAIQYLIDHPGDSATIAKLAKAEGLLAADRVKIYSDFDAAQSVLGPTLKTPKIPVLEHLTGT